MKKYLKHDEWQIIEEGLDPHNNRISESVFSIGNGRMGQRAITLAHATAILVADGQVKAVGVERDHAEMGILPGLQCFAHDLAELDGSPRLDLGRDASGDQVLVLENTEPQAALLAHMAELAPVHGSALLLVHVADGFAAGPDDRAPTDDVWIAKAKKRETGFKQD